MSASQSNSEVVLELAEEFLERYRRGERPSLTEYVERYPSLAAEIREVFPAMAMMENIALADESLAGEARPSGEPPPPEPLRQLGDYRIIREVGRGGMGIVYEAEQVSLGRHVALKVLPKKLLVDAKHRRRFEREAKAAAKLHHTNIVPVFGVGEYEGLPYYVMQFIQGLGLDEVLDELIRLQNGSAKSDGNLCVVRKDISAVDMARSLATGEFTPAKDEGSDFSPDAPVEHSVDQRPDSPSDSSPQASSPAGRLSDSFSLSPSSMVLPGQSRSAHAAKTKNQTYWQSVARVGVQVADALDYAHKQGIQHRDIKPSNLLLDTRGVVWITDFGLAKAEDQQNLTHTGDILGTLRYLPPETFEGKTDARGDIYALGLTLYEMLAFRPAFDEKDRHKLIKRVTNEEPAPLGKLNPEVPQDLQTIIHKAIDREPARRYPSASEMALDLQRFLDDEPIRARRISAGERLVRWCRRNKVVAALTVTVGVLLVAGTILSLLAAGHFQRLASDERAARSDEEAARQRADEAAHEAHAAREKAEQRRAETEEAKEQLRRQLYLSDLSLARQLWDDGNIDRLKEVLMNHRPRSGESDVRGFEWYYWWRAAHLDIANIPSTQGAPFGQLAVSPDGKTVAASEVIPAIFICDSASKTVVRWLQITLDSSWFAELLQKVRQEERRWNEIYWRAFMCPAVAFSRDGAFLVAAGPDHLVRRWETRTWTSLPPLEAHGKGRQLVALAVSPSRPLLASADDHGEIVLWDTNAWKSLATFPVQEFVTSLTFAPDGATLIAALKSGQLARVSGGTAKDALQRDIVATAKQPDQTPYQAEITSLAYDPRGALLATGGADHRVLLWDAKTFRQLHAFEASAPVLCAAFSADGRYLAAGTEQSNAIHVWDVPARQLRATIKGHSKNVRSVAFVGDAERLWSASEDGKVKTWELSRCRPFETVSLPISVETTLAFGSDGRTLFIHGENGVVHQWPFAQQAPPALWNKDEKATELAFGPDGAFLATWSQAQKLRLWDLADNNLRGEWAVPNNPRLNWPYPGQLLAVARGGSTVAWTQQRGDAAPVISVLNVANGKRMTVDLGQQPSLPAIVTSVALSADAKRLASQHIYLTALWDLSGAQPALSWFLPYPGPETALAFSPDGEDLAIGNWNNDIRIVVSKTGQLKQRLRGHAGTIYSLAFARDGTTLVSGSADGTVRLWDAKTGDLRSTFTGHDGPVISVAISPDCTAVGSCSLDQTVRVWRAATSTEVTQKNQEEGQSLKRQGEFQILRGNWKPAAAELARAVDLLPPGTPVWHDTAYRLAFVLVYTGETEKYQALCRRTVRDFQPTTDLQIAERTSTMSLFAGSVQDPEVREQAGRFADFAIANIDGAIARKQVPEWLRAFIQHAKGIAEYRRGNYALALDWFAKSVPGMAKAGSSNWIVWCQATDLFFSAMAAHQLGKIEETRKALAEARRLISTIPRADNTDWLMMEIVRREAEALIEGKKLGYHVDRP